MASNLESKNDIEIRVSAPGKVILHGEHATVYGKAAIASSLNLRCHLRLQKTATQSISIDLPDLNIHKEFVISQAIETLSGVLDAGSIHDPVPASKEMLVAIQKFVSEDQNQWDTRHLAVATFLYVYFGIFKHNGHYPGIAVHMKSELPVGAGLGSSAAFSVSLVTAVLELSGHIKSAPCSETEQSWTKSELDLINKWAFIGEKVIHGQPSGIDNSTSTYGGAIRLHKGQISHLERMPTLSIMLVNTKVPRSTKALVAGFRERFNSYQSIFDPVLEAVEAVSQKAEETYALLKDGINVSGCYETLENLVDFNQHLLDLMGVGHPTLHSIVSTAQAHGFHAKLTGAGGGGCAYVLIPPNTTDVSLNALKREFENLDFEVWVKTSVGGRGVCRHT